MTKSTLYLPVGILFFLLVFVPPVKALSSCEASVSESSATINTTQKFNFSLSNTDDVNFNWIRISRPSANYSFTSAEMSGWSQSFDSQTATFSDNFVYPNNTTSFSVDANLGSQTSGSESWTVQVSDDGGNTTISCSGSLSTSIVSGNETLTISSISISSVSNTSVKINWTTNISSNSYVQYGKTDNFGSEKSDSSLVTSHSLTLTSLTADTTYYFQITSTDSNQNSTSSDTSTFNTSENATYTVLTPTPSPDNILPKIALTDFDPQKTYGKTLSLNGTAFDSSGIYGLWYSLNGGTTYTAIPNVTGMGNQTVNFNLKPKITKDGKYSLIIKASDNTGNAGYSSTYRLTVDVTPPKIKLSTNLNKSLPAYPILNGTITDYSDVIKIAYSLNHDQNWTYVTDISFLQLPITLDGDYQLQIRSEDIAGNQQTETYSLFIDQIPPRFALPVFKTNASIIFPDSRNQINLLKDSSINFQVSLIGGAVAATLSATSANGQTLNFPLTPSFSTLWTTTFKLPEPGSWQLNLTALDGAGNSGSFITPKVESFNQGQINAGPQSTVRIYQQDSLTKNFYLWDGSFYELSNPQKLDHQSNFELYLPTGTYYLKFSSPKYRSKLSNIFTLTSPGFINPTVTLKRTNIPWFPETFSFYPSSPNPAESENITQEIDYFPKGQYKLVALANSSSPYFTGLINFLNNPLLSNKLTIYLITPHQQLNLSKYLSQVKYLPDLSGEISLRFPQYGHPEIFLINNKNRLIQTFFSLPKPQEILNLIQGP